MRKSSTETCVNCGLPAHSPIAQTPGAVVFSHSAAKWRFSDKELTDKAQHPRYSACRRRRTGEIDPIWENFTVALNIRDKETEALVAKIALLNQYNGEFATNSSAYQLVSDSIGGTPGTLFQLAGSHV